MRYWPNPAHKLETTEAGPPRWRPDKEPCPRGMTSRQRTALLRDSIPEQADSPDSRRFAVRQGESGLEFFAAQAPEPRRAARSSTTAIRPVRFRAGF